MSARTVITWCGRWICLGFLVAAGWGCARFRAPPALQMPPVEEANRGEAEPMAAPPAPAVSEPDGAGDRAESDMTSEGVQTQEQADPTPPADLDRKSVV